MNSLMQIFDDIFDFIKNLVPTGAEQWLLGIGAAIGLGISIAVGGMDKMIYALIAVGQQYRICGAGKKSSYFSCCGFVQYR